ncbi:hypothetical protein FA13DRAFT_1308698 [Coprinellus micaceus]|uniref:Uncharacterized protein n=1 Tax=Coprinellus micaceus TaxID=71717 RepID=A0A4Y7R4Q6_COPMI|nr:hypothetical protein FA13DRAFT_1308698 [Coprinellus micaceus]
MSRSERGTEIEERGRPGLQKPSRMYIAEGFHGHYDREAWSWSCRVPSVCATWVNGRRGLTEGRLSLSRSERRPMVDISAQTLCWCSPAQYIINQRGNSTT